MSTSKVVFARVPGQLGYTSIKVGVQESVQDDLHRLIRTAMIWLRSLDFFVEGPGFKLLTKISELQTDQTFVEVRPLLKGGKGGFAALMKNQAAQKRKFSCTLAARDLSGRLVRDIKNEIRIKKWLKKKMLDQIAASNARKAPEPFTVAPEAIKNADSLLSKSNGSLCGSIRFGLFGQQSADTFNSQVSAHLVETPFPKDSAVSKHLIQPVQASSHSLASQPQPKPQPHPTSPEIDEKVFAPEDLKELNTEAKVRSLPPEILKNILRDLGAKCGGSPSERATRLWEICQQPSRLLEKKYRA